MFEQKRFVESENAFKLDSKSDLEHGDGGRRDDVGIKKWRKRVGDQALWLMVGW